MIWQTSEPVIFAFLVLLFGGVLEAGFRAGQRAAGASDEGEKAHVMAIQAAVFGLLALLLGFTFAMSVSRYETRKALVLEEANAIGTASLRAGLLPPAQDQSTAALFRALIEARLAFFDPALDQRQLDAADATAADIEAKLWAVAVAASALDPRSVSTGLFVESVNAVLDVHEKRRVAFNDHVPEAALYLLTIVSIAAVGFLSYGCGLSGRRRLVSNACVALLIALVLVTILDIDRPRRGLITVSQDSLVHLKASLDRERR